MRIAWVLSLLLLLLAACREKAGATTGAPEEAPPVVTDATVGLMLTWIDEAGEFHVEQKVADVPPTARDVVRVRDPVRGPSADRMFVADLRNHGPDGKYAVRSVPSDEFEKIAVERRKKKGAVLAATSAAAPQPSGSAAAQVGDVVVIYGAEWCGPCHQVQAYLRRKGIPFVDKDIDNDPAAAREMQAKLARVGRTGGSIPVLDVKGRILVGFDPRAIDQALGAAR